MTTAYLPIQQLDAEATSRVIDGDHVEFLKGAFVQDGIFLSEFKIWVMFKDATFCNWLSGVEPDRRNAFASFMELDAKKLERKAWVTTAEEQMFGDFEKDEEFKTMKDSLHGSSFTTL